MILRNNGIYFKQTDSKEEGYFTEGTEGNLIHHKYKKPTFWERTKYFAKYGYEMNLETNSTSYLYFPPGINEVYVGTVVGDAITVAKYFRNNRNFNTPYNYLIDAEVLKFETTVMLFILEFSQDGFYAKAYLKPKNPNNNLPPQIFTFLDWDKI